MNHRMHGRPRRHHSRTQNQLLPGPRDPGRFPDKLIQWPINTMATQTNNPYEAPALTDDAASRRVSRIVAVLFLLSSAVPTCIMLFWLGQHFIALYESPSQSYRPIIGAVGFGMSILTVAIGLPTSLVIKRFCSGSDRELVDLFYGVAGLPTLLGIVGPFIIVWLTGSSFGT